MTRRQSEAWSRAFADRDLNVESAAVAMGIKNSSVTRVSHDAALLGALQSTIVIALALAYGFRPPLQYLISGLERQEEALASLSASQIQQLLDAAAEYPRLMRQYAPIIERMRTPLQDWAARK